MKKYEYSFEESRKRTVKKDQYSPINKKFLAGFVALAVVEVVFYYIGLGVLYSALRAASVLLLPAILWPVTKSL